MSGLAIVLVPPRGDGLRADLADTFIQADEVGAALQQAGYRTMELAFGPDREATAHALAGLAPDLVFNLVEDVPEGADQVHLATALLDRLGLAYTGAHSAALRALAEKPAMKAALRRARLPTPADLADVAEHAMVIVKSSIEHASLGLDAGSVVRGRAAAIARMAEMQARLGGFWFGEAYIEGRELNLGLLEVGEEIIALPVAEIVFANHAGRAKIVGYDEKWATGSDADRDTPRCFVTAGRDAELCERLEDLGRACWSLFGLHGYARVDFRVDEVGEIFILEVNANPCISAQSGFIAAAAEIGLSQQDVIAHIAAAAR